MYASEFAAALSKRIAPLLECPPEVAAAGELLGACMSDGGVVHLFGSGHSALVVRDVVSRAGGLVPFNQIVDLTSGMAEPLEGYGDLVMRAYDEQYQLLRREVLVVVSHSGANPLPVEVAWNAKGRGLSVIAVLARSQSEHSTPRHSSGQRLHEIADVVVDTGGVFGDALVPSPSSQLSVGPGSGVLGTLALQMMAMSACDALTAQGVGLPVFMSKHLPGAAEWNADLRARYRGRLRRTAA